MSGYSWQLGPGLGQAVAVPSDLASVLDVLWSCALFLSSFFPVLVLTGGLLHGNTCGVFLFILIMWGMSVPVRSETAGASSGVWWG